MPPDLLRIFRSRIESVDRDVVRCVPVSGDSLADGRLAGAKIMITGILPRGIGLRSVLNAMPDLGWIHHIGAGYDTLLQDLEGRSRRDLLITNSAGAYAPAIAEFVLAGMVRLARGTDRWIDDQRRHQWRRLMTGPLNMDPEGHELYRRRLGIVGYGAIGRHLAQAAKGFGMEVWAMRRSPVPAVSDAVDRMLMPDGLDLLLSECDFIVIAASLNPTTRALVGAPKIALMKPTAILINIARGAIVDSAAVASALRAGRLRGALLDAHDPEPLPADSPLWDVPNLVITPHLSGATSEGYERSMELFCANLRLFIDGQAHRMGNLLPASERGWHGRRRPTA